MLTIELDTLLSAETLERLKAKAQHEGTPLGQVVREAIEEYLDTETLEDTPDEKIIADFRQAWHEAMTGQHRSARAALDKIHRSMERDDDER